MAQKTQVMLVDDLDGSDALETVSFGLDGIEYQIDLSEDNAKKIREFLAGYIEYGRRTGGRRNHRSGTPTVKRSVRIRQWAQENGYEISRAGRLPASVIQAYENANGR